MNTRVHGTLRVTDRVLLETPTGTFLVITSPPTTGTSWWDAIRHTADELRHLDGQQTTVEGFLWSWLLLHATVVGDEGPAAGSYRGRLDASTGGSLQADLRFQPEEGLASVDFFRDGNYLASARARMSRSGNRWTSSAPRLIFDWESRSAIGGSLEIRASSPNVLELECTLPEAAPTNYSGAVTFESEYFRILNIEVDKLSGMPWPPHLSTSHIPAGGQPSGLEVQDLSIEALFRKAGIEARVQHSQGDLAATLGGAAGRPGEEDRWDEREMHEMMQGSYSRNLADREWWLYLLVVPRFDGGPMFRDGGFVTDANGNILNDGEGTMGIIFDHSTGVIHDPWSVWLPDILPQFRHLFDFGREGGFGNERARQGCAVFWTEFLDFFQNLEGWDRDRRFLRTIIHELGHALNLAHSWLVNRSDSTTFMQYPQNYPHGVTLDEKDRNYWRDFDYRFDPEEIFHFVHGFYNEVIPGGTHEFMDWTPSSVFQDPSAGGMRSNLQLQVSPGASTYRFMEPVTFDVQVRNTSSDPVPVGRLSPSYGNLRYLVRRPDGNVRQYRPPLYKCEGGREPLQSDATATHTTSLTVDAQGYTFDTPGRYEITALLPDPSTGAVVVSRPAAIWVGYPDADSEAIAARLFDRDSALFLYMGGGEHLRRGKEAMQEVADAYGKHPMAAHANLVLGLNELFGQKSVVEKKVKRSDPSAAAAYFSKAAKQRALPESLVTRLEATMASCDTEE